MSESFIANIQVLRRIAIPIEVYEAMKLQEGQQVRVAISCVQKDGVGKQEGKQQ